MHCERKSRCLSIKFEWKHFFPFPERKTLKLFLGKISSLRACRWHMMRASGSTCCSFHPIHVTRHPTEAFENSQGSWSGNVSILFKIGRHPAHPPHPPPLISNYVKFPCQKNILLFWFSPAALQMSPGDDTQLFETIHIALTPAPSIYSWYTICR